ncbi:hypothetical protein [Aequorivita lipolytica]|uniref:Uncharacterized protein n=1 Tax=Aequorivita lipolytica TaxID=153267 RepID=A0A5C6YSU5_9FLAO|nr:hypothetical protein [Aequorivita lipolytica]TXD70113.1 hypothetical protein ESV24_02785 [Aequorivita lipolytica]SRX50525.1 hypothetical protein AEQU2_00998 [Aequorivita lipolytica]
MTAKEFWAEFENYEETLRFNLNLPNTEKIHEPYNYLFSLLDSYHSGLEIILDFNKKKNKGKYKLTISCNANRDLFMYVNRLVDAAPSLSQWEIEAFKQAEFKVDAKLLSHPFDFDDFSIWPKDVRFTVTAWDPEKDIFDLLLLLP